jgi:hypothetical protein
MGDEKTPHEEMMECLDWGRKLLLVLAVLAILVVSIKYREFIRAHWAMTGALLSLGVEKVALTSTRPWSSAETFSDWVWMASWRIRKTIGWW